jgi:hypothetical protein
LQLGEEQCECTIDDRQDVAVRHPVPHEILNLPQSVVRLARERALQFVSFGRERGDRCSGLGLHGWTSQLSILLESKRRHSGALDEPGVSWPDACRRFLRRRQFPHGRRHRRPRPQVSDDLLDLSLALVPGGSENELMILGCEMAAQQRDRGQVERAIGDAHEDEGPLAPSS